jgi:hypothetical protein
MSCVIVRCEKIARIGSFVSMSRHPIVIGSGIAGLPARVDSADLA